MKFLLDENLPLSAVDTLRNLGFAANHVRTEGLQGTPDKDIAAYAKKHHAILITKDLEFGSILLYP